MEKDINTLKVSEQHVVERMAKTQQEKHVLSSIVSSGSDKMLSDQVYVKLCGDVNRIFRQAKPSHPDGTEVPVLSQLLEIERFIEDCAFIQNLTESFD